VTAAGGQAPYTMQIFAGVVRIIPNLLFGDTNIFPIFTATAKDNDVDD
jgi:hypothetical protein